MAEIVCGRGKPKFQVSDALFNLPVSISLGQLLQVSPTVRRELRTGIALDRPKKPKPKGEAMEVEGSLHPHAMGSAHPDASVQPAARAPEVMAAEVRS